MLIETPFILWNHFVSGFDAGEIGKVWVLGLDLSEVKAPSFPEPRFIKLGNGIKIMTMAVIATKLL